MSLWQPNGEDQRAETEHVHANLWRDVVDGDGTRWGWAAHVVGLDFHAQGTAPDEEKAKEDATWAMRALIVARAAFLAALV